LAGIRLMDDKKLYSNFVVDKCPDEIEAEIGFEFVNIGISLGYL